MRHRRSITQSRNTTRSCRLIRAAPPSYPGELEEGECSESVKEWQERLVALGHSIEVDGAFGPATEEATKAFQSHKGLAVDGIVGHHTWEARWS
jgi:peptidoglycan hydrolase-like protein with peptidoglycan-binding domain